VNDEEVSKQFWEGFKKRDNSFLVDLFYGQLKSKLECSKCGFQSLTFDAFNMLSLPIPTQENILISVKYIPADRKQVITQYKLTISEFTTVYELKTKIKL
jgi:ubiquitin C-terminal hydrolase